MTPSGQLVRLWEERKGANTKFIFLYLVCRLRKEIKFEMFAGEVIFSITHPAHRSHNLTVSNCINWMVRCGGRGFSALGRSGTE